MSTLAIATTIFITTYVVIVSERLDRTVVALAGGALMIAAGVLSQPEAVDAIDFNTLILLIGMMIIVNVLKRTGIFRYLGWRTAIAVQGSPWRLLVGFTSVTAIGSAFLDNVTTVLLMVPVTIAISEDLGLDTRPFLISEVIASNIGGTATLIGDPPNILVGSATGLDFVAFLANLAPLVVLLLLMALAGFWLVYARGQRLGGLSAQAHEALTKADLRAHIGDERLLRHAATVLFLTLLGFTLHGVLGLEAGSIAMFGAIALLLLSRVDVHHVLAEVEWSTIFFFVGLFVLVGGIEKTGLLERIAQRTVDLTAGNVVLTALLLLWLAALMSAIVDNIPAIAALIPLTFAVARLLFPDLAALGDMALAQHEQVVPLWWSLALGASLGGNGTLVGASANVVAAGIAERRGEPIGFWGFTRVGLPFTVVSLVIASLYVWLRYLAF